MTLQSDEALDDAPRRYYPACLCCVSVPGMPSHAPEDAGPLAPNGSVQTDGPSPTPPSNRWIGCSGPGCPGCGLTDTMPWRLSGLALCWHGSGDDSVLWRKRHDCFAPTGDEAGDDAMPARLGPHKSGEAATRALRGTLVGVDLNRQRGQNRGGEGVMHLLPVGEPYGHHTIVLTLARGQRRGDEGHSSVKKTCWYSASYWSVAGGVLGSDAAPLYKGGAFRNGKWTEDGQQRGTTTASGWPPT